ncbi:Endogenous retrovirus group K member 8 Pro protein [Manis javanica]|nr:Endogenous retrovirus group K member 8 Pro protein [Manis javanica]
MTSGRPQCKVWIQGKHFTGLLDTGADVSVIALKHWPKHRPKQEKHIQVSCVGTASQVQQSSATLHCLGPEKQLALLKPLIVDVAIILWRRGNAAMASYTSFDELSSIQSFP